MNELNYSTLEASRKLAEAGIVLVTEMLWCFEAETFDYRTPQWRLYYKYAEPVKYRFREKLPAPSMAEVWRELPAGASLNKYEEEYMAIMPAGEKTRDAAKINTNPTDALIDLLIWVRKEKQ